MNREIKFRAWDGEMMVWNGLYVENGHLVLPNETTVRDTAKTLVWMQFTGLHDKNGKEIYEGDVVRVYGDAFDEGDEPEFEVKWDKEGGYFMDDDFGDDYRSCLGDENYELEVIGNVFENPELIEKSV